MPELVNNELLSRDEFIAAVTASDVSSADIQDLPHESDDELSRDELITALTAEVLNHVADVSAADVLERLNELDDENLRNMLIQARRESLCSTEPDPVIPTLEPAINAAGIVERYTTASPANAESIAYGSEVGVPLRLHPQPPPSIDLRTLQQREVSYHVDSIPDVYLEYAYSRIKEKLISYKKKQQNNAILRFKITTKVNA